MRRYQKSRLASGPAVHPVVHWIWKEMNRQRASQEDVADRSGVSSSGMRKWRKGVNSPKLIDIEAVVQSLGGRIVIKPETEDTTDIRKTVHWMQRVARESSRLDYGSLTKNAKDYRKRRLREGHYTDHRRNPECLLEV